MGIFKGTLLLIAASFSIIACASAPESSDPTGQTAESALTANGGQCSTDASCKSGICNPHCPVIPGRAHCEIAGGTCGDRCEYTKTQLEGKSFASTDGAHSIVFATDGTFVKHDGCPTAPGTIHCNHIQQTTGTFRTSSSGKTVYLTGDLGSTDTLDVEPHCYQGLLDTANNVELYPSN